jgi:hypothetical protein
MTKQQILSLAKGHAQKSIVYDLLNYGETEHLGKYMKKQSYYTKYCQSFANLFSRLRDAGINVKKIPGKLGGDWSAKFVLQ